MQSINYTYFTFGRHMTTATIQAHTYNFLYNKHSQTSNHVLGEQRGDKHIKSTSSVTAATHNIPSKG